MINPDVHIWYHPWPTDDKFVNHADISASARWDAIRRNIELKDKTVLDIGAFDGYFSFKSEAAGAKVLATDRFCWHESADWNKDGFDYLKQFLGSKIEEQVIDPAHINVDTVGLFDVVFLLGVIYHRIDFYNVFLNAANVCNKHLVVSTHIDTKVDQTRPAFVFYPNDEFFGDHTNWFVPNYMAINAMYEKFGFKIVDEDWIGENSVIFFGER